MRRDDVDLALRVKAAGLAAQYRHSKKGEGGTKAEKKDAAAKAGNGAFAPSAPPRLAVDNTK